jgi:hypothetical protein
VNTRCHNESAHAVFWILAITASVHLLGSAILFGVIGGPLFVMISPLLSILGWFFLIPEFCGVLLLWSLYDPVATRARHFWLTMCASVLIGALFMGIAGPKEQGHEVRWTIAYMFAGGLSAAWSLAAIRFVKKGRRQRA